MGPQRYAVLRKLSKAWIELGETDAVAASANATDAGYALSEALHAIDSLTEELAAVRTFVQGLNIPRLQAIEAAAKEITSWDWSGLLVDDVNSDVVLEDVRRLDAALQKR